MEALAFWKGYESGDLMIEATLKRAIGENVTETGGECTEG